MKDEKSYFTREFTNSSNIRKIEFDEFMNVLSVFFVDGKKYDFVDVNVQIFYDFANAESPGKYFHTCIRGKYEFMKNPPNYNKTK